MRRFVINCDASKERWAHYKDEKYTRWSATHWKELPEKDPKFDKMISYHNINPNEHKAKVGCLVSHTNLWRYLISNKMNNILVLEDDAVEVRDVPLSLPVDGISYLGGIGWHPKITDNAKKLNLSDGVHKINFEEFRILMTMSYYIPTWELAEKLLNYIESLNRWRAIDVLLAKAPIPFYISYPASFVERGDESLIRKSKNKKSNEFYDWVKK
jgi:GR25 family glycosyltransferase involved in LPS biosynthesis